LAGLSLAIIYFSFATLALATFSKVNKYITEVYFKFQPIIILLSLLHFFNTNFKYILVRPHLIMIQSVFVSLIFFVVAIRVVKLNLDLIN
jgi:hypothetical protein